MINNITEIQTAKDFDNLTEHERIKACITFFRLYLYNRAVPYGSKAIQDKLRFENITPVPSISTINRVLKSQCLRNGRTGYYQEDYPM